MKSFYEMLRILESEEVKTPGGHTLTPEELEDYENEKSPMYKALFLQDIDAKRKAQEINPEVITKKEERPEEDKITINADPYYLLKMLGVIVDSINKSEGICKSALNGVALGFGIKKDGDKWKLKKNEQEVPPYDKKIGKPTTDQDIDSMIKATELLFFALKDSEEYGECEIILDALYKLGAKPYLKVGDTVNFDGRHHDTKDGVVYNEKVLVSKPGLLNCFGHLLDKALVKKI